MLFPSWVFIFLSLNSTRSSSEMILRVRCSKFYIAESVDMKSWSVLVQEDVFVFV